MKTYQESRFTQITNKKALHGVRGGLSETTPVNDDLTNGSSSNTTQQEETSLAYDIGQFIGSTVRDMAATISGYFN